MLTVAGLAILNFPEGTISNIIPSDRTPSILMLMDHYKGGIISIPCSNPDKSASTSYDSFHVTKLHTKLSPSIREENLFVQFRITIEGTVGELSCSQTVTEADITNFKSKIRWRSKQRIPLFIFRNKKRMLSA